MNLKLVVSATAAALFALSAASFAQTSGNSTSARPQGSSGSNIGGVPPSVSSPSSTTGSSTSGSAATGATASRCATLTGPERDQCLKEAGATTSGTDSTNMRPEGSSGSNVGGVSPRMGGSSGSSTTR